MSEHAQHYARISQRAFHYHLMDLRRLRSLYAASRIDVPRTWVDRIKRPYLVEHMLQQEFGEDAVEAYNVQCKEWDEMKAFVEGSKKRQ